MSSLTILAFGRLIPTTPLLRTRVFKAMDKKETWRKWSSETWKVCLNKAEKEVK